MLLPELYLLLLPLLLLLLLLPEEKLTGTLPRNVDDPLDEELFRKLELLLDPLLGR